MRTDGRVRNMSGAHWGRLTGSRRPCEVHTHDDQEAEVVWTVGGSTTRMWVCSTRLANATDDDGDLLQVVEPGAT